MDAERRELQRRERSGDDDGTARGRLLSAKLRAGEISRERVQLLAYLGHRPAIDLVGDPFAPPTPPAEGLWKRLLAWIEKERAIPEEGWVFEALGDWVVGLGHWGKDVPLRGTLAALEVVIDSMAESAPPGYTYRDAVDACWAWIECPCLEHGLRATEVKERLFAARAEVVVPEHCHFAGSGLDSALDACAEPEGSHIFLASRCAALSLGLRDGVGREADPQIRAAVSAALVPWVLAGSPEGRS